MRTATGLAARADAAPFADSSRGRIRLDAEPPGRLACAGAASPLGYGAVRGDGLAGYCFRRAGHRFSHIGPLVARDVDAACGLVGAALDDGDDPGAIIDVPAASAWLSTLAQMGFREQRPLIRMYRGGAEPPGRPDLQLAILGPEFG